MTWNPAQQAYSWTCPDCGKTWISALRPIRRCERCGRRRTVYDPEAKRAYQRAYWRTYRRRAGQALEDSTTQPAMSSDGSR